MTRAWLIGLALGVAVASAAADQARPEDEASPSVVAGSPDPVAGSPVAASSAPVAASSAPVAASPAASATVTDATPRLALPSWTLFAEVFARYTLRTVAAGPNDWFHEFDLPRAQVGVSGEAHGARLHVLLEAVRSSEPGALLGVAGDSIVTRVREAWIGNLPSKLGSSGATLEVRAGMVPTLTVPVLEAAWQLRAVAAMSLEADGLVSPADLGVTASAAAPAGYGTVSLGAYDGEGYAHQELNRGKNLELAVHAAPAPRVPGLAPLGLLLSYTMGSTGTALARADRLVAALLWQSDRLGAGFDFTRAFGVGDAGSQRSDLFEAFVRGEPLPRLLVGARGSLWRRDNSVSGDRVSELLLSAGWRISAPLEVFAVGTARSLGDRARAALPDTPKLQLDLVGRGHF